MARENKKGSSFGGLDLEASEEVKLKKHLVKEGNMPLKRLLRFLIRKHVIHTTNGK